jgi:colanic acid biosynthesis glycosyl transferase WcaI
MRICICDYSGHPLQVSLSRELARRRHDVLHLHFAEFQTPKGKLTVEPGDPPTLIIDSVSLGKPFAKYSFIKRRSHEIEVGKRIAARIEKYAPDIVVGSNLPIDALGKVISSCRASARPFVFWQQDIYSVAIAEILQRKFGILGRLIGSYYKSLERRAVSDSAAVVTIAEDFNEVLKNDLKITKSEIYAIENWAPLDEIVPRPKVNAWSQAHGLADKEVVLYTGTLGLKHNPEKILAVAERLRDRPNARVVVVSEGPSANWLAEQAKEKSLEKLVVLPFQPYDVYPDVLGAADIVIGMIESYAGTFCVPGKIASYMSAGRPIVLSAPSENLASHIVRRAGAGIAVPSDDTEKFVNAIESLLDDDARRAEYARAGRIYSEETFDIVKIGNQFENVLTSVTKK